MNKQLLELHINCQLLVVGCLLILHHAYYQALPTIIIWQDVCCKLPSTFTVDLWVPTHSHTLSTILSMPTSLT